MEIISTGPEYERAINFFDQLSQGVRPRVTFIYDYYQDAWIAQIIERADDESVGVEIYGIVTDEDEPLGSLLDRLGRKVEPSENLPIEFANVFTKDD